MRKRVLQFVFAAVLSSMLLAGCEGISFGGEKDKTEETGKKDKNKKKDKDKKKDKKKNILTEKDIDINELKEKSDLMLNISRYNCDLVSDSEDYWSSTDFNIYYDGTIIITSRFHLSGDKVAGGQLSDEDYVKLYLFGANAANNDSFKDIYIDACDGVDWSFSFYDGDGNSTLLYSGYIYGVSELEEIQNLVDEYRDSLDFTWSQDGASGGYEYEYIPTIGTWEEAFYYKLIEAQEESATVDQFTSEYPYAYYLCDISGNGTPELVIKQGSCEADYNDVVYAYDNGEVVYIDTLWSGHSSFYSDSKGGMYQYTGHMGYGSLAHITMEDESLSIEVLFEESGYDDNGNWDDDFEYTSVTDTYPGTKYINYVGLDNYLYLATYDGSLPVYSYTDEVADELSAEEYYLSVINNNEVVYAVGDGYMNTVGATAFNDLLKEDVMYDYCSADMEVIDYMIADVDGNGSYECVLFFSDNLADSSYSSYFTGVLSQEDGMVFCYLKFARISNYLSDDGYLIEYDEWPVKTMFYKDQIIWEVVY